MVSHEDRKPGGPVSPRVLAGIFADQFGDDAERIHRYASQLRPDYIPAGGPGRGGVNAAEVSCEQAVNLLIACLGAANPAEARRAVETFAELPLASTRLITSVPGVGIGELDLARDDRMAVIYRYGFAVLRRALVRFIHETALTKDDDERSFRIVGVGLGGGRGTGRAKITVAFPNGAMHVLTYSTAWLGGGRLPDDAAPARLDRTGYVPGQIVDVLADLFGTGPLPRMAPAEVVDALVEQQLQREGRIH